MFDNHVRWSLSASWVLLVVLAFLGTNVVFTRNVTLLVAAILILPLILFALLTRRHHDDVNGALMRSTRCRTQGAAVHFNVSRMRWRTGASALGILLAANGLAAQDHDRYRDFRLGSDVATVSLAAGVVAPVVKVVHQRPALIQELTWRPRYAVQRSSSAETDATEQIVFSFYNDRLFRLTVDYDRERTEGLTDTDMIEAISAVYGSQVKPPVSRTRSTPSAYEAESGTPVARWGDADDSLTLYRSSSYATSFRLIMTATPLAALARTAAARAAVLDEREAPEREAAREKQEAEDRRAAQDKARSTNKAIFRP
jgi:hypothetical protein